MIIRFEVSNYRSFAEPTELLLTPGRERQHNERIPFQKGLPQRVLPVAVIYGANASGKSNLVEAIHFLKMMVIEGTQAMGIISRAPFKLDKQIAESPSRFALDFIALDDKAYSYLLEVSDTEIVKEELIQLRPNSEEVLFRRRAGEKRFDVSGLERLTDDDQRKAFFQFTAEGTRANQAFLHEAIERDITELKAVLDWFRNNLAILDPHSRPQALEEVARNDAPFREFMVDFLRGADTGIDDIETDDLLLDEVTDLPSSLIENIKSKLKPNEINLVQKGRKGAVSYLVRYRDNEIHACRLRAIRRLANGKSVSFDPEEESDGTRRYMELAMAFYALGLSSSKHVFIIDELDRSLHPGLCRAAVERFLARSHPESRCQLIFTTHDVTLMTQDLFRRDEIWLTEKDQRGATQLKSLGDFKDLRNDKVLRRNYLEGRYGGVPVVQQPSLQQV